MDEVLKKMLREGLIDAQVDVLFEVSKEAMDRGQSKDSIKKRIRKDGYSVLSSAKERYGQFDSIGGDFDKLLDDVFTKLEPLIDAYEPKDRKGKQIDCAILSTGKEADRWPIGYVVYAHEAGELMGFSVLEKHLEPSDIEKHSTEEQLNFVKERGFMRLDRLMSLLALMLMQSQDKRNAYAAERLLTTLREIAAHDDEEYSLLNYTLDNEKEVH